MNENLSDCDTVVILIIVGARIVQLVERLPKGLMTKGVEFESS